MQELSLSPRALPLGFPEPPSLLIRVFPSPQPQTPVLPTSLLLSTFCKMDMSVIDDLQHLRLTKMKKKTSRSPS